MQGEQDGGQQRQPYRRDDYGADPGVSLTTAGRWTLRADPMSHQGFTNGPATEGRPPAQAVAGPILPSANGSSSEWAARGYRYQRQPGQPSRGTARTGLRSQDQSGNALQADRHLRQWPLQAAWRTEHRPQDAEAGPRWRTTAGSTRARPGAHEGDKTRLRQRSQHRQQTRPPCRVCRSWLTCKSNGETTAGRAENGVAEAKTGVQMGVQTAVFRLFS